MKPETHRLMLRAIGALVIISVGYWILLPARWLLTMVLGHTFALYFLIALTVYCFGLLAAGTWFPRLVKTPGKSELLGFSGAVLLLLAQWPLTPAARLALLGLAVVCVFLQLGAGMPRGIR